MNKVILENGNHGEYQTTWPASWEIRMQVKKQQLEVDMEQLTSSMKCFNENWEKSMTGLYIVTLLI